MYQPNYFFILKSRYYIENIQIKVEISGMLDAIAGEDEKEESRMNKRMKIGEMAKTYECAFFSAHIKN